MPIYTHIYDAKTGKVVYQEVGNEWIIENRQPEIHITANKEQIAANGVEEIAVHFQVITPKLIDNSQEILARSISFNVNVDEQKIPVVTNEDGYAILEFSVEHPSVYEITIDEYEHNLFSFEGV